MQDGGRFPLLPAARLPLKTGVTHLKTVAKAPCSRFVQIKRCCAVQVTTGTPQCERHCCLLSKKQRTKQSAMQAASIESQQLKSEEDAPEASMPPFHLAFPVNDLEQTKAFYGR